MRGIDLLDTMTARCIPSHIDPINGVLLYSWYVFDNIIHECMAHQSSNHSKEGTLFGISEGACDWYDGRARMSI